MMLYSAQIGSKSESLRVEEEKMASQRNDPLAEVIDQHVDAIGSVFSELGTHASKFVVEGLWLIAAVALYGVIFVFTLGSGPIVAAVYWVLAVAVFLWAGRTMESVNPRLRLARRSLDTARVRRSWNHAVHHCGFKVPVPVLNVRRSTAGYKVLIQVGRGVSIRELEQRREHLAAGMRLRDVVFTRDVNDASLITAMFVSNDTLADLEGTAWPSSGEPPPRKVPRVRTYRPDDKPPPRNRFVRPKMPPDSGGSGDTLWDPIPIGIGEHGEPVSITLPERSVLMGGIPGTGKSNCMSMPLARAGLDPSTKLYIVDGKEVELHMWERCAEEAAYSIQEAIALLQILERRMTERLKALRRADMDKVTRESGMPLYALFIDELALFTAHPDTKLAKEFTGLLMDILARGRAPGIIPVMATQKPEGRVVDTNLRDLVGLRIAFCCSTPDQSDTILGKGYAKQGFNAQDIPLGNPGVGFFLAEDGIPKRIRTYHNNRDEIRRYAALAYDRRQSCTF